MFKKLNKAITTITESISVLSLAILSIALFIGVIARYVFHTSIPEIDVIRKFCIMWLVFTGSALAVKEKTHLEIDIFTEYLNKRMRIVKSILVYLLTLTGIVLFIIVGYEALKAGADRTELISIRFLPGQPSLTYYYSAFIVGSILMLYYHVLNIKDVFREINSLEVHKDENKGEEN